MGGTEKATPGGASLFDRLGGSDPLRAAIDDFYRAVLGDAALAGYFENADFGTVKRHQLEVFAQLLGGPAAHTGSLAAVHQPLRIPVEHYQLVVGHLVATLMGMGIPDDVFAAIGHAAGAIQPEIVYDSAADPRFDGQASGCGLD